MRAVITGANSFIGRNLIKGLSNIGYECIAVVRNRENINLDKDSYSQIIELNMEDYSHIGSMVKDIDLLINLAWLGTRGEDRMNSDLQRRSYKYTMDAIRSFKNRRCSIVMTAGSQAEYGIVEGCIKETSIHKPNTEYGKFKLKLFNEAKDFCRGNDLKLIEPRFFSLYGPGDFKGTMIIDIMKKMLKNETCSLTEGVQMWDFLYINDAVEGIISLLKNDVESGAYNFASGDVRQLKDYIIEMKEVLGSKSRLDFGAIPYPKTGMVSIVADISKLLGTGWYPKTSFGQGVKMIRRSL